MISIKPQFTKQFRGEAIRVINHELLAAHHKSTALLETKVAENTPVNFGTLRGGIIARVVNAFFSFVGVQGPATKYAPVVEEGRKAGGKYPPPDAITLWVKRKIKPPADELKSVSFLVGRKIAEKGTTGAKMFEKAEKSQRRKVLNIFWRHIDRAEARLSG